METVLENPEGDPDIEGYLASVPLKDETYGYLINRRDRRRMGQYRGFIWSRVSKRAPKNPTDFHPRYSVFMRWVKRTEREADGDQQG